MSEGLATTLATEREQFLKYESSRALFFRDDQPLHAGDTLKNPDLAWTLEQIAKGGADAFYKGEIAKRMVADLHAKGNAMKLSDMARYFAAERDPVGSTYRGYTFFSSAPPVSGGAELAAKLNLLEHYPSPKPYTDDAGTLHAMIAAWQLVPSTRNRIADPSLWPTTTEPFTNKDTARIRWACFDPSKAINPAALRGDTLTLRAARQEDGVDRADARSRVHRARLRRQPGRVVPRRGNDGVRRRRRRRQPRGDDADARHVGRKFLRHAGFRILVQRQADVVRHRSQLRTARGCRSRATAARSRRRSSSRERANRCGRRWRSARRATRGSRRPCTRRSSE